MDRRPLGTFGFDQEPSTMTEEELEEMADRIYESMLAAMDAAAPPTD
jgi:hypothetical protein